MARCQAFKYYVLCEMGNVGKEGEESMQSNSCTFQVNWQLLAATFSVKNEAKVSSEMGNFQQEEVGVLSRMY